MHIFISEDIEYYDEDGEGVYKGVFSLYDFLNKLRLKMVVAAQSVYDNWQQEEDDDTGGICHDIADAMASVVYQNSPKNEKVSTFGFRDDSQCHNWFVAYHPASKQMYEVDIPFYHYEIGGGYNWKKINDVKFTPNHIMIRPFLGDYDEWVDEDGNPIDQY